MKQPKVLLGIIAVVLIGAGIWWWQSGGSSDSGNQSGEARGVTGDPVNIVLDFYEPWLSAVRATNTDPIDLKLHQAPQVSVALSERLEAERETEGDNPDAADPVLCQTDLPEGLRARPLFQQEATAQVLVMAAKPGYLGQAVVDLSKDGDLWQITDITCSFGESAPPREFSFETEGFLLKSVPPPLDPSYWHIVFEQGGVMGHAAPLFFSDESTCRAADDSEIACDQNGFTDAQPVFVQGEMTESGVEVKNLKLLD